MQREAKRRFNSGVVGGAWLAVVLVVIGSGVSGYAGTAGHAFLARDVMSMMFVSGGGPEAGADAAESSPAAATPSSVPDSSPSLPDVIVDNRDRGDGRLFRVIGGTWTSTDWGSRPWPVGGEKSNCRYAPVSADTETARAEWSVTSLPEGDYEVFAWWGVFPSKRMGRNVAYEIHAASGVTVVRVDQNVGGQWRSLGVFHFSAGGHRVQIHNGHSAPGRYVAADAVRFVGIESADADES